MSQTAPATPFGQPINNRPATYGVVAILAVSALAVAFLLWILYVHHAPSEFRTRFLFLPQLNALLNGLSAIALTIGYFYIRSGQVAKHRAAMLTAFFFSSIFLVSYIANHSIHGPQSAPPLLPHTAGKPYPALDHCAAHRADHLLPVALRPLLPAQKARPLHLSPLALCLGHRSHRLLHAPRRRRRQLLARSLPPSALPASGKMYGAPCRASETWE
jgi:hypothetical protein